MAQKYKKLMNTLEFLEKLDKRQRKTFLQKSPNSSIRILSNFIWNLYTKNFPLSDNVVLQLKPLKKMFVEFCKKKNSLKLRKNLLLKGNFLFKILSIVIPHMNEILSKC